MFRLFTLCVATLLSYAAYTQPPSLSFELKKPEAYKEKPLGSERMADKKFKFPRTFLQSTYTHYNYFFNANEKVKTVIYNAKKQFKEDYTELLPFYNYTHEATKAQKNDLDSVLDKTSAGILIHDLRNAWIDNMFLLMGEAFYYRTDYDSALMTFQYMNVYYKPGTKDEYTRLIGSNRNEGESPFTIASKEKRNIVKKVFTRPPSYNDALLWQARCYIEMKQYGSAISLIEALRNDPNFPKRLKIDYEELQAYYYYKIGQYDSSARHLIFALPNAANKNEKARWEFLIGQMLTLSGNNAQAQGYYNKSIAHTYDPVMDVYARLNQIALAKSTDNNAIQKNIDELVKMAKREKYQAYRGIIYYTAAKMEMQRNNFDGANKFIQLAIKYSADDPLLKDRAYLYFGDLAFDKKMYQVAYNAYDSLGGGGSALPTYERAIKRKAMLAELVYNLKRVYFEDSLQRIAGLSETERIAKLKKILRQLRKEQGLKEDAAALDKYLNVDQTSRPNDLFNKTQYQSPYSQTNNAYSGWYFGNLDLKSRGFTAFKQKWGNRPNQDNWRRIEVVGNGSGVAKGEKDIIDTVQVKEYNNLANVKIEDLTIDILESSLPLTPGKLKTSNDTLQVAMFKVGKAYMNKLEDHESAVNILEDLVKRFDTLLFPEDTYFSLYYCYYKLGNTEKAAYYKNLLIQKYPSSKQAKISQGNYVDSTLLEEQVATRKYEEVYNAFIEGRFDEALATKRIADSLYGLHHWTPQLLYIEAMYYVRQRQDSIAISRFEILKQAFPDSPVTKKVQAIIDVLKRRTEIESYLTNLNIERIREDSVITVADQLPPRNILIQDSTTVKRPEIKEPEKKVAAVDSVKKFQPQVFTKGKYTWSTGDTQYVAIILNKVDPTYAKDAENGFKSFTNAQYKGKPYQTSSFNFSTTDRIILIGPFANAPEAIAYVDNARANAKTLIVPWLAENKYSFLLFSRNTINALYQTKDLPGYRKFIKESVPGKF